MNRMTVQERNKYAYELMVKNNPEETVKQLLLKDKEKAKLETIKNNLIKSISSIDKKISENVPPWENGYINSYRITRLRAFRTKCKELLDIIEE